MTLVVVNKATSFASLKGHSSASTLVECSTIVSKAIGVGRIVAPSTSQFLDRCIRALYRLFCFCGIPFSTRLHGADSLNIEIERSCQLHPQSDLSATSATFHRSVGIVAWEDVAVDITGFRFTASVTSD